ncbi:MAG TPA: helix-turn-helix transcriptional regulator [Metabacillus sp.]|nr:helix-turn-helix transcriptional regulator [Metabacillus sp.]
MKQLSLVSNYFPLQPELKYRTNYYLEKKELTDNIATSVVYYQFRMEQNFEIVPDGCIDVLYSLDPKKPEAMVCGSPISSRLFPLKTDHEYFGVKFFPSSYPMSEALNQAIPLTDLFKIDSTIIEQIADQEDFKQRINVFKRLFNKVLFNPISSDDIQYSINRIFTTKGKISIEQLASEIGFSSRYLRKKFKEYTGISPKLFSQINRFQHSLYMLTETNECSVWDIICENGYHDQAHLIHEFTNFGYLTPSKFIGFVHEKKSN